MNRTGQLQCLIDFLLAEMPEYREQAETFPPDDASQRRLLRSLMNVRPPMPLDPRFLEVQDKLLSAETAAKGVVDGNALPAAAAGCGGQSAGTAGETSETSAAGAGETTDSQEAEETAAQDEASDSQDEKTEGGEAAADGESYTIGIGQYAVHGSLDNCREGFLLGLAEAGIEE